MTLDSVKYTLLDGREAVALVNLEGFVAARSTGTPSLISVSFISVSFEQTTEQWRDLKSKLMALLARGRNNLDGILSLPDPVIVRPPTPIIGDLHNLSSDSGNDSGETTADLSTTVAHAFDHGLSETIHIGPRETALGGLTETTHIGLRDIGGRS